MPREKAALAAALHRLLADPGRRARLGAANRAKTERDYDDEITFGQFAALIDAARHPALARAWRIGASP